MINVVAIASLVALVVVCLLPHLHPNSAEPQPVPNMSLGQGVGSISGWASREGGGSWSHRGNTGLRWLKELP